MNEREKEKSENALQTLPRRNVAALLLGTLGGVALTGGTRQARASEGDLVGRFGGGQSGANTDIVWVPTVLGAAPPAARTGSLATSSGPTLGGTIAIAEGCVSPGDGGGGVFQWIVPQTMPADDGGTLIVPSTNSSPPGYWQRFMGDERAFNVLIFGAQSGWNPQNGNPYDSTQAIQNAINAASSTLLPGGESGGGKVIVPPGRWFTFSTLYLYGNVVFEGAAPGTTAGAALPYTTPCLLIAEMTNGAAIALHPDALADDAGQGVEIRNIAILHMGSGSGCFGIDFTGVCFGKIENVFLNSGGAASPQTWVAGSVGLRISDQSPAGGTVNSYYNMIERISIGNFETGFLQLGTTAGNAALNTLRAASIINCLFAITAGAPSDWGLTLIDLYMGIATANTACKAFRNLGGLPIVHMRNVFPEGYQIGTAPYDWPCPTFAALGYDGHTAPLEVTAVFRNIVQSEGIKTQFTDATYGAGGDPTTAIPQFPMFGIGPDSFSFWAKITANTTINPGDTFNYYVARYWGMMLGALPNTPPLPPGLFVETVLYNTGGITTPITLVVAPSWVPIPPAYGQEPGATYMCYAVTVLTSAAITPSSDLVFLLKAGICAA